MQPIHNIHELVFDLSFSTKKTARREQENIQNWIVESLLVDIDKLFDQYSNTHQILRFDQLTIDVGNVSLKHYPAQISQKIISELASVIAEQMGIVVPQENGEIVVPESAKGVVLAQLVEFLFAGYMSRHSPVQLSAAHEVLFSQLSGRLDVGSLLRALPNLNVILKRLAQQFSQVYLSEILQQICPVQFDSVLAFVELIELTDFSSATSLHKKAVLDLLWEQLLIYFVAYKVGDSAIFSWAKPFLVKFANALNLTDRQLMVLVRETSERNCEKIHIDLIAYLYVNSTHVHDIPKVADAVATPWGRSANDQYDSLFQDASAYTDQQIEFLLTSAFENEDFDFILSYWQKIRSHYSSVALKVITSFSGDMGRRKKLIDHFPDAYLIDFIFLIQPQSASFLLLILKSAEKLHIVIKSDKSSISLFDDFKDWKSAIWQAFFSLAIEQKNSAFDSEIYWQRLLKESANVNNKNVAAVEEKWLRILGDDFGRSVAHGNSIEVNSKFYTGVNVNYDAQIKNETTINAQSYMVGSVDLTLLNEQQVQQLVAHAIASMNVDFLINHWGLLKLQFPNVLLKNLHHYLNRLELRQDIIAALPDTLLLDTVELLGSDIYPTVSALIRHTEILYGAIYSKEDSIGSSEQWRADVWQACFNVLLEQSSSSHTSYFLILNLLDSLSTIYNFDVQSVAPKWFSICKEWLPVSNLTSSFGEKPNQSKLLSLEEPFDDTYVPELVLIERYLFFFDRSQAPLNVLLQELLANAPAMNRLYNRLELNFTSLMIIQLPVEDWLSLIQFYMAAQAEHESAHLLDLLGEKAELQTPTIDSCYKLLARLFKSDASAYGKIIESFSFSSANNSSNEFISLCDNKVNTDCLTEDEILFNQAAIIDKNPPAVKDLNKKSEVGILLVGKSPETIQEVYFPSGVQQDGMVELKENSHKAFMSSTRDGVNQQDLLNLSSHQLITIVTEFIETNISYLPTFKIDLLSSIHSHAAQTFNPKVFYNDVLQALIAGHALDLEAIVNEVNTIKSPDTEKELESIKAISFKETYEKVSENLLSICEQLKNKSINIMQVNADEADLWNLLVAYLETDESILDDFQQDMLAAFERHGENLVDKKSYYRNIISALIEQEILDLETFSKSLNISTAVPLQRLSKSINEPKVNSSGDLSFVSESPLHDRSFNNNMKAVDDQLSSQDLMMWLQGPDDLNSSQIVALQKIINNALRSEGFSSDEWTQLFSTRKVAEKFIRYVPGHILHQLFLRLRPKNYEPLDELVKIVLGALALLAPTLSPYKVHQVKWIYIAEYIFGHGDAVDENTFLQKLSYKIGAAAGIDDLQRLLNLVQRRRVSLRPAKIQQTQFSQEKILEVINSTVDSKALTMGLHVNNVGLVLVAPYLPRLFSMLELVKGGEFIHSHAADRAVHLLQYIVTGQSQTVEYELVLNKILCGISTTFPVSSGIDITEQEKLIIEQMLTSVIQHWSVLGSTSITGLRETFFQRQGWLRLEEDAWHLDANEATFDMLIDHIPWSFSLVKYGWMDKSLHVKWRSKE